MVAASTHLHQLALLASDFTDPKHERLIYVAAGGLALLGVVLLVATVAWWRGTKGEHSALAPLELMGQRAWLRAPYIERVRRLEDVRVRSADDPEDVQIKHSEEIDLNDLLRTFQPGFDDLRDDPVPVAEVVDEAGPSSEADAAKVGAASRLDVADGETASDDDVSRPDGDAGADVREAAADGRSDEEGERAVVANDDAAPVAVTGEVADDDPIDSVQHGRAARAQAAPDDRAAAVVRGEDASTDDVVVPGDVTEAEADTDDAEGVSVGRPAVRAVDPLLARGAGDI